MRTLSVKVKGTYSDPTIGYIRPLLIESEERWVQATPENVPVNGEVVTFAGYTEWVDTKFKSGEIFQVSIEEMEDTRKGDCEFTTAWGSKFTPPDPLLGLHTVITYRGVLDPNRPINTSTLIKPTRFSFVVGNDIEVGKVILGPLEIVNAVFNDVNGTWDCSYSTLSASSASRFNLEAYELYYSELSLVESSLFPMPDFSNADNEIYLSFDMHSELHSIKAQKRDFIKDETLIKFLDDALTTTKKIGRSGRRDLMKQIDAVQILSKTNKDRIKSLLDSHEERFASFLPVAENGVSPSQLAEHKVRIEQLNELITELRQDLGREKARSATLAGDLARLENQAKDSDDVRRLEAELDSYKLRSELQQSVQSLEAKEERLANGIEQKKETLSALHDTISEVEVQLNMSMRNFRAKAMEVLPLFGVLSSSGRVQSNASNVRTLDDEDFCEPADDDYVKELFVRLKEQNYLASDEFLFCASALFLSSKFMGLFGPPGTGKTTLAELLTSASCGDDRQDSCMINVGKGWSSNSDFFGYLNPFSDQFSFKNDFFEQFLHKDENALPLKALIFDEASLSSPDVYLSDFFSKSEYKLEDAYFEVPISGSRFYFPSTFSFLMTFNFDEGTERLSPKFIDRVPILHCDHPEHEGVIINKKQYKPFNSEFVRNYLSTKLDSSHLAANIYREPLLDEIDRWKDSLPRFEVSLRKKKHLLLFSSLINEEMDISVEYMKDFVSMTFLLPQVYGFGDEYRKGLEAVREGAAEKTKSALTNTIEMGSRFNQFTYF